MEDTRDNSRNYKSIEASNKSFVIFYNKTQRKVDVVWLNYQGNPVLYQTLLPGQYFEANTFVTHPWIFRDSVSKDKLVVESKEHYLPTPWNGEYERVVRQNNQMFVVPRRTAVYITLPMYSLVQRSMQVLRNSLRDNVIDDCIIESSVLQCPINSLGLPATLEVEFLDFVKQSFQQRQL